MGEMPPARKRLFLDAGEDPADIVDVTFIKSGISKKRYGFHWELTNFEALMQSDELLNLSTEFPFTVKDASVDLQTSWIMQVVPQRDDEGKDWLTVMTRLERTSKPEVTCVHCQVKVEINDKKGKAIKGRGEGVKTLGIKGIIFAAFLPVDTKLEDLELINGSLFLTVELEIYSTCPTVTTPVGLLCGKTGTLQSTRDKLLKGVASLRTDLEGSDLVTIKTDDNSEIKAHRFVLTNMSPLLKDMFETEGNNVTTKSLFKIKEVSKKSVETLLDFMYTGKLDEDFMDAEIFCGLVTLAQKFQMEDLLQLLVAFSKKYTKVDVTRRLLDLAAKLNLPTPPEQFMEMFKQGLGAELENVNSVEDFLKLVQKLRTL